MATVPTRSVEREEEECNTEESVVSVPPLSKDLVYNPHLEQTNTDPELIRRELPDIHTELKLTDTHGSQCNAVYNLVESASNPHSTAEERYISEADISVDKEPLSAPSIIQAEAQDEAESGISYEASAVEEDGHSAGDMDPIIVSPAISSSQNLDAFHVQATALTGTAISSEKGLSGQQKSNSMYDDDTLDFGAEFGLGLDPLTAANEELCIGKQPSAVEGSALEKLLREYLRCEEKLDEVYMEVEVARVDVSKRRDVVWVKKTGVVEQTQPSRHGSGVVKAQVSFPHAEFSTARATQLQDSLKRLRDLQFNALPTARFDRTLAKFHVEQFLYRFFSISELFTATAPSSPRPSSPLRTAQADKLTARHYFTVLREVEREVVVNTEEQQQWQCRATENLRAWGLHVGAALLTTGDRMFLLYHAVRHKGVGGEGGRWMASLVQPSEEVVAYCQSLAFLLAPSEEWQSLGTVQLGRGEQASRYQSDGSTSFLLTEEDFIKLFQQFPHDHWRINYANHAHLPALERLVDTLGEGFCRFQCYPQFARLLSGCCGALLCQLVRDEEVPSGRRDPLILQCMRFAMQTKDRISLDDLPLKALSPAASWHALLSLVLDVAAEWDAGAGSGVRGDGQNGLQVGQSGQDISQTGQLGSDPLLHQRLAVNVLTGVKIGQTQAREIFERYKDVRSLSAWVAMAESDQFVNARMTATMPAPHRLLAMVQLGIAQGAEVANAVLRQLFVALLASQAATVAAMIGQICRAHPEMTTLVLHLLRANLAQLRPQAEGVIQALELKEWRPTREDLECLAEWIETGEVGIAMSLMEGMNYGYAADGELMMGAQTHREIAAMLAANVDKLEAQQHRSIIAKWVRPAHPSEDYRSRSFKVLLRLKLIHPVSHTAYLPPLRLEAPSGSPACQHVVTEAQRLVKRIELSQADGSKEKEREKLMLLYVIVLTTDAVALHGCGVLAWLLFSDDPMALKTASTTVEASTQTLEAGATAATALVAAASYEERKRFLADLRWLAAFMRYVFFRRICDLSRPLYL